MDAILSAAADLVANSEADLSVKGKAFCDLLTAEQWKVVRGKKVSNEVIASIEELASAQHFSDKAHSRQRLYELAKIAKMGSALSSGQSLDPLVTELKQDIHVGANTPSAYALLGACHIAGQHYERGVYYFNRANHIAARTSCITGFMALARSIPSLSVFDVDGDSVYSADLEFVGKAEVFGAGAVSVVAGNSLYINRFIDNYARSVAERSDGAFAGIHVHWVKDVGEHEAAIDQAMALARSHGVAVNLTAERVSDIVDKKSYYAQARFLIARRLSVFYGSPLMITDLDFQLCENPRAALTKLSLIDVSFLQHEPGTTMWAFPWLRSMAGSVWVNNTPKAREFFRLVEQGFDACFNPTWFNWGIDQNLLTTVLEQMSRNSQINFASMTKVSERPLYDVPRDLKAGIKFQ
ncbi:hypothetical protein [Pseudomonas faucium]|uniref:hypothetical protein n=1 Tax=Pseudomonas faucium TaxID=2740518 RepID=UPI0039C3398D